MAAISITVFTPSYNRGEYLKRLYASLQLQSRFVSEWLIIDDGSTDNTAAVVENFVSEGVLPISYYRQANAGKHRAINQGVQLAKGELFFIVDSDDYLTPDALEEICRRWSSVLKNPDSDGYAGLCGLRIDGDGLVIGGEVDYDEIDTTTIDYRYRRGYRGDKAEVYRTDVLRTHPFPDIEEEKFCTEALVWNRIAASYKLRFFNKGIYVCQYLPEGLSSRSFNLRKSSPQYASLYYAEFLNIKQITWSQRIKGAMNFWRFAIYDQKHTFKQKRKLVKQQWTLFFIPLAYFLCIVDWLKAKSE
ncbi:glycosyltransferase family A protein [Parapedobacter sp. DT-150]|uniref:glycosyltransferase family A protein n=1 Tax=Parapedobacter sp. DT-150 TaxID=3396162 RepID=UPI003F1C1FF9